MVAVVSWIETTTPPGTSETKAYGLLVPPKTNRPRSWLRRDVKYACGLRVRRSLENAVQEEAGISEVNEAYFRVQLNT